MHNVRLMMEPNTATKLKTRKRNVLKDYVAMAGPFGVTHLLAFNKTKAGTNLVRRARTARPATTASSCQLGALSAPLDRCACTAIHHACLAGVALPTPSRPRSNHGSASGSSRGDRPSPFGSRM